MERRITLETKDLTTGYASKGKQIIVSKDVTESLRSGQLTCLLGRNGSGKSTILKTLSSFLPPLNGEIFLEGKRLKEYTPIELAKVIGVVLTERFSASNMKVRELVATGRSPFTGYWGRLTAKDREIIDKAMENVEITDLADRQVVSLSDGERQRSFIAKALAQQTPVIFLDEPTAFLDYPGKVQILRLLKHLAYTQDKTVFLSTHDMEVALRIADRLWLMDKKLGIKTGNPEELALSGDIGEYFNSQGLTFDPQTLTFQIATET